MLALHERIAEEFASELNATQARGHQRRVFLARKVESSNASAAFHRKRVAELSKDE